MTGPRIAIVGAGPAGIYLADALTQADPATRVDLIDRLPTPFGLLRYGVAPDHLKMKSLDRALQRVLERPQVSFYGEVEVGRDVSPAELARTYDAVAYSTGAATDRKLGVSGEDLPGVYSAASLVAWYNGHPDAAGGFDLAGARAAAVIGFGNVALDVTRILAAPAGSLSHTDMPQAVLDALAASSLETIHLVGRGGPAWTRFTSKELRELGEIDGVDVRVDPGDLELSREDAALVAADPAVARNLAIFSEWAMRPPATTARRRVLLHFRATPVSFEGERSCRSLKLERALPNGETAVDRLTAELSISCVGYRGVPIPGLPFDAVRGTISNVEGRLLREGARAVREYVCGWARRGPRGVLGSNRSDAAEVAALIRADLGADPDTTGGASLTDLLQARGVGHTSLDDWSRIDLAETELGRASGRRRTKLATWSALAQARGNTPSAQVLGGMEVTSG